MGFDPTKPEVRAFEAKLKTLARGAARTEAFRSGEQLGGSVVPTYLAYLAGAERLGDASEATLLRYALTRMVLGPFEAHSRMAAGRSATGLAYGENELGPREVLLIYRAMLGRTEQSATRCLAKCVQALARHPRHATEPIFRELGVEEWLLARWDAALERNDHADVWDQMGIWLSGPEEQGVRKLADALMLSPENERWLRVLTTVDARPDDVCRAAQKDPALLEWLEARILAFLAETHVSNARRPSLQRVLAAALAARR